MGKHNSGKSAKRKIAQFALKLSKKRDRSAKELKKLSTEIQKFIFIDCNFLLSSLFRNYLFFFTSINR
jgi:hypothetical protein